MERSDNIPGMRRLDLPARQVEGELVILDAASGHVHQLNATASCIWKHCDGTRSVREIAALLASTYDVTPDVVLRDVRAALDDFARLGLLTERAGGQLIMESIHE